ncbi:MAG: methyltransferase domain protein [Podoviridae sp. ctrTa16]|nr:MAG: methyltransferase domain protein [Podoviridae sp. ctrTa16]
MNENLINELFKKAVSLGYTKGRNEFINLLHTDKDAYNEMHSFAVQSNLIAAPVDFDEAIGISLKKKEERLTSQPQPLFSQPQVQNQQEPKKQQQQKPASTGLLSEGGALGSQSFLAERMKSPQDLVAKEMAKHPFVPKPEVSEFGLKMAKQQQMPSQDVLATKAPEGIKAQEATESFIKRQKAIDEAIPSFVKPLISSIDAKLIGGIEEDVVPEMNYRFAPLGFNFEESGATGDWMKVTAPNGNKIEISLDPFSPQKKMTEAVRLRKFISENIASMPSESLSKIEKQYSGESKKFVEKKEVEEELRTMLTEADSLNAEIKDYYNKSQEIEGQQEYYKTLPLSDASKASIAKKYTEDVALLEDTRRSILKKQQEIGDKSSMLDKAVGKYTSMLADKGTWYKDAWNGMLNTIGGIASDVYGMSLDAMYGAAPIDVLGGEQQVKEYSVKFAKEAGIEPPKMDDNGIVSNESFKDWMNGLDDSMKMSFDVKFRDELSKEAKYGTPGWSRDSDWWKDKYISIAKEKGMIVPEPGKDGVVSDEDYSAWKKALGSDKMSQLEGEIKKNEERFQTFLKQSGYGGFAEESISDRIRRFPRGLIGAEGGTPESLEKRKESIVGGAIYGALESIPSFVGGGWASRLARLYAQNEDALMNEMEDIPEFKNISESEKRMVTAPIAIASGVLEEFGFRNIIQNKGVLNRLVMKAIGKAGTETTAKTFGDLVRNEVKSGLARGALTVIGGALAEAETGALQQLAEYTVKDIYNEVKDKEMFKTPEFLSAEYFGDILLAGAQEAIGSVVLSAPQAVAQGLYKKDFSSVLNDEFRAFEAGAKDSNIRSAFVTSLKQKINSGEMTIGDAKRTLDGYNKSVGLYNQLPDNLNVEAKKEAMTLLLEKSELEKQIDGKDESLTKVQRDKIAEINQSLIKISENAIQEPTAAESLLRKERPELELQKVGEGDKGEVVTKEGVEEKVTEGKEFPIVNIEPLTGKIRITNANIRYEDDAEIAEQYNQARQRLTDETISDTEKEADRKLIRDIESAQSEYFNNQLNDKLKDVDASVEVVNTGGYWENKAEHSFEVKISAKTKEDYYKALSRMADFSSEQSQDAFIEVKTIPELDVDELKNNGVLFLKDSMEDGSVVTSELSAIFDTPLSLDEKAALDKELSSNGIDSFTSGDGQYSFVYFGEPTVNSYKKWLETINNTFKNFFNGKANNFISEESPIRTWYHSADSQETRGREYRGVKNNLQKRYSAAEGFGNKKSSDTGDNGKQEGEPGRSGEDIGESFLKENHSADTQNFFTEVQEGKHRPSKDLEFVLPLNENLKAIHRIWSVFKSYFDEHIETNIPAFREVQLKKISAILELLKNGGRVIDLGGSTGSFVKTITKMNPKIKSENLEPNDKMIEAHNSNPVDGSAVVKASFQEGFDDIPAYVPSEKYDVVHESMLFQFIKLDRSELVDEIADKYVKDDGVVILEEKVIGKSFDKNESNKDENFKLKYYTQKYLDKKKDEVLFGMKGNQATQLTLEDELKRRFKYVYQYWDGGNFKGYLASNSKENADKMLNAIGDTNSQFSSSKPKAVEQDKIKSIASAIRKGKIKTEGLQANIVGIPIAIWNGAIETVATAMEAGASLIDAINEAIAKHKLRDIKAFDEASFVDKVSKLLATKETALGEESIPGYDRLVGEIDGIIKKSEERGASAEKTEQNVMNYVTKSAVYERASDVQRELLTREVRKRFGRKEKTAPSVDRILGEIKDVKKVTLEEYAMLKKQIRDFARGARTTKAAWIKASKELYKTIKEMRSSGRINASQAKSIIRRFTNVNLFNQESVDKFVDYMERVFSDAEYAEKIDKAFGLMKLVKNNIGTKLGIAKNLIPSLYKMSSISPYLIPSSVFDRYLDVMSMIGERKAVLSLEDIDTLTASVNDIIDAVNAEESSAAEMYERYLSYEDKVMADGDVIDVSKTVAKMVDEGVITKDDADILNKYMSKFKKEEMPEAAEAEAAEGRAEDEKANSINRIKDAEVNVNRLQSREERQSASELVSLSKTNAIESLDQTQLNNLERALDNINNGYFPAYAQMIKERLNAELKSNTLADAVSKAKPLSVSRAIASIKNIFTRKGAISEMTRRSPLYYIDVAFGIFNGKPIFNSVFEKVAEAESSYKSELKTIDNKLIKALDAVANSFKNNPNKVTMSKYKMTAYFIQKEYEANPNNKQVVSAYDSLMKTIEYVKDNPNKTKMTEKDADALNSIIEDFGDGKTIDAEKIYRSFNEAEKNAVKTIEEVNDSISDKALYTSAIIRGDRIKQLSNWIHHNVIELNTSNAPISSASQIASYSDSMNPSTKAKTLIERTPGAKALNFDIFESVERGAKLTLMDYYLTEPIRIARITLNKAKAKLKKDGEFGGIKRDVFNAIDSALEESLYNTLSSNFHDNSFVERVINELTKQGYRAVLASVPRFVAEFTSNVAFGMIAFPSAVITGIKLGNKLSSTTGVDVMRNVNSKATTRIYHTDPLSGKNIDTNIMNQTVGIRGGTVNNDVANKTQQIYNNTLKKYKNFVELTADTLISTPDKIVMRWTWFGSFANKFKEESGVDVDFDKIAANDEQYMSEHKDAIEKARLFSDERSVLMGASDNPFMGILKGSVKPNQNALLRMYNVMNSYMTRFMIYEYMTSRQAIMSIIGKGSLSRENGAKLLAAVISRMTAYTLLYKTLSTQLLNMLVSDEDEDEEKAEKGIFKSIGQSIASAVTSLAFGRDFGNTARTLINYGVEEFNEEYLDFLREGEYDKFKDAIQYSPLGNISKRESDPLFGYMINFFGAFSPIAKTLSFGYEKISEGEKKREDAITRQRNEIAIKLPIEMLGNIGLIPLYRDTRNIVNKQLYKDLENAKPGKKKQDEEKPFGLNKTELKKYFPELYEVYYGIENAMDVNKIFEREQERLKREMMDEMFNYHPKKRRDKPEVKRESGIKF